MARALTEAEPECSEAEIHSGQRHANVARDADPLSDCIELGTDGGIQIEHICFPIRPECSLIFVIPCLLLRHQALQAGRALVLPEQRLKEIDGIIENLNRFIIDYRCGHGTTR